MSKLVYKVGNEIISPRQIVIFDVDNNKEEISFGTREKDSFNVNTETLGSIPLTPENLEAICTEMKQIKDVNYPKNDKGFIVVTFTDETSVRYGNSVKPTIMAMVNLQKHYEKVRKAKVQESAKKRKFSVLRIFPKKATALVASAITALALSGCNITITSSKDTSSDFTISIGTNNVSKSEGQNQPQGSVDANPVVNFEESEEQAICREDGTRLWNDLMRENPKIALHEGFFKDEPAYLKENENLAIDYISYLCDIPSLNMQSMTTEELTRHMSKLLDFGNALTRIYANPSNSDSQKIAVYNYLRVGVSKDEIKIIKNAYALMANFYYSKEGDSRRVSLDKSSESEQAKLSKSYSSEQQKLMSYIQDTLLKDTNFTNSQSGVKFAVEDAFSYGMAEVPYSTFVYDDFGTPYYCKYFERSTPYTLWVPENRNGTDIFFEKDMTCHTSKEIGTHEKMMQFMNSYNSGNNTDLIEETGTLPTVEDLISWERAYAESLAWINGSKVKGS